MGLNLTLSLINLNRKVSSYRLISGLGTLKDWDTVGLVYSVTFAQWDWNTTGLKHNRTGTLRQGHNRTGTQWDN